MSTGFTHRTVQPLPGFSEILRDHETFGSGDEEGGVSDSINSWFDLLMLQSGMKVSPSMMLALSMLLGVVAGGTVMLVQDNPLTACLIGGLGAFGPVITAIIQRQRRQRQIMQQLPAMIDELARAAKTGRSIEQCWHFVANDTPQPLGEELMECSRRMAMGEDLSSALRELPTRTGVVTLNILVTALTVHQQTGGDLVSVLERLSQTIRDRLLFLGRLRAATTGSRATAVLMLALPPAIVLFFSLRDASYFPQLMASAWGRQITIAAVLMEAVGTLFILRILQNSQRS
jgi:tight adherence protein B